MIYFQVKKTLKSNCYYNVKQALKGCLGVWLRLLFKIVFACKYIKIFFIFLKKKLITKN
jgi:hypothetical protein